MKLKLLFFITFFFPCLAFAQSAGTVKGSVVGAVSNEPVPGVIVTLTGQDRQVTTDANGNFIFRNLQPGSHVIQLNSVLITPKSVTIEVEKLGVTELEPIKVTELNATEDISMIGVIDAGMVDDDVENASQDVSSTVILSNDVFLNRAAYQLSPARFSPRGYTGSQELKYINGVEFNDQNRGVFNYASVGALNDMTRNGDVTNFTAPSTFTFGALGGAENINMRASSYTPGGKATVSYTNRNYYLRGMFTYSTGLNEKGWAFTASAGGRYSHEGNIDGTFYNNLALAFSAEKQWQGGKHSLSMTAFVSPVQRGQQGNSYREVYELTDNYLYNPNWGYQNGKKRNAKVVTAFDPTAVISHIWKIDDTTTLTTGVGAHYARYGNTALNWYNAPDPRPDYYRYLPSYFEDEDMQMQYRDLWRSGRPDFTQINWDNLYLANANNLRAGNGAAVYMVEERRSDLLETSFNSTLNKQFNRHLGLTAGVGARFTQSRQFKTVDDLLGSNYVLDIDKFAERDFSGDHDKLQNDLNRPDRKVYKDGIFGYNFNLNIYSANAWAVNRYTSRHVYMVEERRSDLLETSFNSTLNKQFNRHLGLTAGVGARFTQSRQFKTVDDLLGSNYVLDIDKFAERDFSGDHDKLQNDLNRPDRKVYKDGIFGYNFNLNIYSANAWAVNRYTSRHWDYYYGAKLTYTNFRRDGKMRNGRYPDSSYGKGIRHQFTDITVKGGLTYKFNGRHMLTANISYGSEAPLPNEAYISPRITDRTIDNMKSGRIFSADLNYVFSMPQLAGRIGVFQTNFYDQMERNSYYDGIEGTFINHVLYGVNRIHRGLELGATYKLDDHWSFDLAGTISEYYYSNNPDGVKHSENGKITDQEKVYMKDVYVGGMPQFAGTFGVRYFVNYWFLGANVNGFARNYIEVAPLRRLSSNYASVNPYNPEQMEAYRTLTTQERFPAAYTVDISVGKIFYLPGRQSVNFNLSVNNLLNKKDICTGGYEQGRSDLSYPTRFGGKYYYMQGLNCFLNVSYRF